MKIKAYIAIILSNLMVLLALFFPLIHVTEIRMDITGEKIAESFYINIIDYVQHDVYNFTMIVMIILACFNFLGVINGIYGLVCKKLKHASINLALFTGFASGIAGALHLYSKSYVFFIICAASFIMITLCSFKLNKSEVYNYKQ